MQTLVLVKLWLKTSDDIPPTPCWMSKLYVTVLFSRQTRHILCVWQRGLCGTNIWCPQLYYLTFDGNVTVSDAMKTKMKAVEMSNKSWVFLATCKTFAPLHVLLIYQGSLDAPERLNYTSASRRWNRIRHLAPPSRNPRLSVLLKGVHSTFMNVLSAHFGCAIKVVVVSHRLLPAPITVAVSLSLSFSRQSLIVDNRRKQSRKLKS